MLIIVLTFLTQLGKVEVWGRFCQELPGSQQQIFLSSRRSLGITYERMVLVGTTFERRL